MEGVLPLQVLVGHRTKFFSSSGAQRTHVDVTRELFAGLEVLYERILFEGTSRASPTVFSGHTYHTLLQYVYTRLIILLQCFGRSDPTGPFG